MAKDVLITPASGKLEVKASNGTTVETKIEDGNIVLTGTLSASGYNDSNWNTGYGWGNHASAGYATESYVGTQIANLIASAPGTLDTLNELAEALDDDPNFATTVTNSIATKLALAGGTLTGDLSLSPSTSINPTGASTDLGRAYGVGWPFTNIYLNGKVMFQNADVGGSTFGSIRQYDDEVIIRNESSGYDVVKFDLGAGADSFVINNVGNVIITGTITASGYNDSNWNSAYTHSQQAHAPSNAEQNVKSDWSAGSGDAEILNKPNVQYTSAIPEITATVGGLMSNANAVKFAGIATGANLYTHPTHPGDDISVDTTALTGATVISDLDFNVTTDVEGHVTDANGTVATRTLTLANLGYTGATNANYITNNNQLTNGANYITDGNTNWDNSYGFITSSSTETLTNKTWNGTAISDAYISSSGNWNTAHSWGNHASQGYITDGNTNWDNSYGFITNNIASPITIHGGSDNWTSGGISYHEVIGLSTGSIHLDPDSSADHYGSAITFGASDNQSGTNAQAGIYTISDGTYGTKMIFGTTNSYANGVYAGAWLDHVGNFYVGGTIYVEGHGNSASWNDAHGWGNHASAGYVTSSGVTSVATGGGLTGGTITTTGTISHADTSSQASLTALTGANVVSDIDLDTYGHVTSMATRTMTLANLGYTGATNANYITNNNQLTNGANYITGNQTITLSGDVSGSGTTAITTTVADDSHSHSASTIGTVNNAYESYAMDIEDTRNTNDATGGGRKPQDMPGHQLSAEFTDKVSGASGWHSLINMKGWSTTYASWQLIGGSTTGTHENLYFRSGLGSTWNTTRTILHSGNWSSTITLASLGYTGATNANYITNNNQLTNGANYITDGNTNWDNSYGFITASSTETLSNKSGNISQWTNNSNYATQAYVGTQIANIVDSAPGTLDTLNELASALGDDANFSTTVTNSIATKLPLAGGTMSGDLYIIKDAPKLVLDSSSSGSNTNEQSAVVSIGESGTGNASIHVAYTGDGYGHIGMGSLGADNIPDYRAMRLYYTNNNVYFPSTSNYITDINSNANLGATAHGWGNHASAGYASSSHSHAYLPTTLSSGYTVGMGSWGLRNTTPDGYIQFGPANTSHAHIYTDRSNFYFNVDTMYANGHIMLHANNYSNYANLITNNNQLTNGMGFTTYTANQAVDTNSNVTFNTLQVTQAYNNSQEVLILNNGTSENSVSAYYDTLLINQNDVPTIRLNESANSQEFSLSVGNENSNSAVLGCTGQFVFATGRTAGTYGYNITGEKMRISSGGNVGINTTDFSYTQGDNTHIVGSKTDNKLFINGSIQLINNNDSITIGRSAGSFFKDEEIGFGWGGGWYMIDGTYLRVRNNKHVHSTGDASFGVINWTSGNSTQANTAYAHSQTAHAPSNANYIADNSANWNTAYGWGNHASAGYITDGNTNWDNSYGFITNSVSGYIAFTGSSDQRITMGTHSLEVKNMGSSTASGIVGRSSNGTFTYQIYGTTSGTYGFLDGPWGGWDIQKTSGGDLKIDRGGTLYTVLDANNYSSYANLITNNNQLTNGAGYITSADGGNATTVDGLDVHTGRNNEANKIVRTQANGYIDCGWINTTSGDSGISNDLARIYCSYDNYLRYLSKSEFKVLMGLSKNTYDRRDYTADTNYWTGVSGNGTVNMNTTLATYGSGFFDTWSSPTGQPPSGSHYLGHQVYHYNATSNIYGYQMAYAGNQNKWYLRAIWSGTTWGSWFEILHSGNWSSSITLASLGYTGATNANYITNNNQLTNGAGYSTYSANQALDTTSNPTFADGYTNGWWRNNNSGQGLYNTATGQHFYSDDDDFWNIAGGTGANGLKMRDESGGTLRGTFYATNSNQIGILDNGGNWRVQATTSGGNLYGSWAIDGDAILDAGNYGSYANLITNNNQITNGAGYTTYSANQAVDTSSAPTFSNLYLNGGWYRNTGVSGMYNSTDANHFYSDSASYWCMDSNNGLIFRSGHAGTIVGYVYWDGTAGSNNFGLLSHDGTWSVQCTSTATYLHNASYVDGNLILHAGNYSNYAVTGVTSVATGGGLTGGTITSTGTISHADTSSQASSDNSGRTYIQDITLDTYGHVTGLSTATETVTDTNTTYNFAGTSFNSGNSGSPVNPNNQYWNYSGYCNSVSLFGQTDGGLWTSGYSSNWVSQIFSDFRTGQIAIRGKNNGTWQSWRTVLDSSNWSSTVTLASLGYTGATNANYITNNNQLTNGAGYTTYSANQAVDTTSTPSFADVYTTGWFRNSQDNEGLYNTINGNHFYSSTNYWDMDSPAGLRLRDAYEGGIKGYVYWSGSNFGLLSQNGSWRVQIEAETSVNIKSVDLICDADVIAFSSSDRRLKNDLKPIEDPIAKIRKLTGYTFTWNELQSSYIGEDIGVVAQEVNEVVPEVVTERDDGYLAVKYEKMIPLLIEAMKEQQDQIDDLKKQIEELRS